MCDDVDNKIKALLLGERIVKIAVEPGEERLSLKTDSGIECTLETYGDCCSETWFAELLQVDQALGHVVTDVLELHSDDPQLPDPEDGNTRQESDSAYGLRIVTDGGFLTIVYRNSSNGYYGGSCDLTNVTAGADWADVRDDWTAYGCSP